MLSENKKFLPQPELDCATLKHRFMFAFAQSRKAVPLLILLVTILFLFPVEVGSFQATHGPTTTLKECLVGLLLQALIAIVGYVLVKAGALCFGFRFVSRETALLLKAPDETLFSLRC